MVRGCLLALALASCSFAGAPAHPSPGRDCDRLLPLLDLGAAALIGGLGLLGRASCSSDCEGGGAGRSVASGGSEVLLAVMAGGFALSAAFGETRYWECTATPAASRPTPSASPR